MKMRKLLWLFPFLLASCGKVVEEHPSIGGLSAEQATFIRTSYYENYKAIYKEVDVDYVNHLSIVRDYGVYKDSYLVAIHNTNHNVIIADVIPYKVFVKGYCLDVFLNASYFMIVCTFEGTIYSPTEAYEKEILTTQDLETIASMDDYYQGEYANY